MIAKNTLKIVTIAPVLVALSLAASLPVLGQDTPSSNEFNLFEGIDNANNSASAAESTRNSAASRAVRNTQAAPIFTLVGTTRIGNRQTALLKHINGETVKVVLDEAINPVPGHELYTVLQPGAGKIAIRYPSGTPCGDYPDQGVNCDSKSNISTLSLTTAEPIIAQSVPTVDLDAEGDAETVESDQAEEEATRRNPFAALRDRNRATPSTRASSTSRFQPRRIDPDEVPPGYRVVSTPFGDRLVEQQ